MRSRRFGLSVVAAFLLGSVVMAETIITPPGNRYSLTEDISLGLEAATDIDQKSPILRDDYVTAYVERVGRRLIDGLPTELQYPEFRYSFKVVNDADINAFALPGGPLYVNRGMIEAAANEGEVAGVVAHEISHVALRHGTAEATKARPYVFGQLAGAVIGAIVGGKKGAAIAFGSQVGFGVAFLRYSRTFERQADLLGAQMMARAGYDPHDMADLFRTIESQSKRRGPQWLSDHPNPGNRVVYIEKEAESLHVENPVGTSPAFVRVQAHLRQLPLR